MNLRSKAEQAFEKVREAAELYDSAASEVSDGSSFLSAAWIGENTFVVIATGEASEMLEGAYNCTFPHTEIQEG